jgi:hypothetical protein
MAQCDCFWPFRASARLSPWQRRRKRTYHNGPDAIGIGQRACQLMDQGHPAWRSVGGSLVFDRFEVFGKSLVSEVLEFFAFRLRSQ